MKQESKNEKNLTREELESLMDKDDIIEELKEIEETCLEPYDTYECDFGRVTKWKDKNGKEVISIEDYFLDLDQLKPSEENSELSLKTQWEIDMLKLLLGKKRIDKDGYPLTS